MKAQKLLPILLFLSASTVAKEPLPGIYQKTMIAGYKSVFTCGAIFNGGREWRDVKNNELHKIYRDYRPFINSVSDPVINRNRKFVSTAYDDAMPPRISAWRPHLGCVSFPVGAKKDFIATIPRIQLGEDKNSQADLPWPDGDRLPDTPRPGNIDFPLLDKTVKAAFDQESYGLEAPTTAIIVAYKNRIIAEQYRDDFNMYTSQRTWSVAKSIAASVIGVAVRQELLNIKAPLPISEWQSPGDPRASITLENVLHMSSGLWSQGNRTDFIYFGGGAVSDHAVTNPLEAAPGKRWKYANNDTLLAVYGLRTILGDDKRYLEFPFRELLFKIGMRHTALETDWQGNFILSSQVWTTARDLARLGILYLNNGKWNGEQILPEWWASYVQTPAPSQPPPRAGHKYLGYGAQFWLYPEDSGLPAGTHAMLGNRGQNVVLVPVMDLVIVRRGYDSDVRFDHAQFTVDILKAIN